MSSNKRVTEEKTEDSPSGDLWIDDNFRVEKYRWGTWVSFDKNEEKIVTSLTEELCIAATRFYLKGKQEGFPDEGRSYTGTVGGKL